MRAMKTSRRFRASRVSKLLVPIFLGALALLLVVVVVVTVLAVMGLMPGY